MHAVIPALYFAGRANRFGRVIRLAGFGPEEILPENDRTILKCRCVLSAVVDRPTARADQRSAQEFSAAAAHFESKDRHRKLDDGGCPTMRLR
jgi:TDG/mug DNA glycosylase family protein